MKPTIFIPTGSRATLPGSARSGSGAFGPAPGGAGIPRSVLEANKRTVLAFYEAALNRKDFAAASPLIDEEYVQHHPRFPDGVEGLRAVVDDLRSTSPRLRVEVTNVFAISDFVIVHADLAREPGRPRSAVVGIVRLEDGRIVEHWNGTQPAPRRHDQAGPNRYAASSAAGD
jgi:predicted SnoaL-like aldol condensation-catalyzing enzyme